MPLFPALLARECFVPAKPSYSGRLANAAAELGKGTAEWVDRRELEEALGVSKTVAWRILKQAGAGRGPGNTRICGREALVAFLRELATSPGPHRREIERRDRLGEMLERIRPDVVANLKRVVRREEALELLSTTFSKLPPNVVLTARTLHIDFFGTEDFLKAVGAVVYALHNDYDAISAFIEDGSRY